MYNTFLFKFLALIYKNNETKITIDGVGEIAIKSKLKIHLFARTLKFLHLVEISYPLAYQN